jgi:hypothetical protein
MRLRTATTCAIAIVAVGVVAASAATPGKPLQAVKVVKCSKFTRSAGFVGRMRAIEGSERMGMRFTLFERLVPQRTYVDVDTVGLGVWRNSLPGVQRFTYRQAVRALSEAAAYRMSVEFRWYDADGEVVREVLRRSRRCRQPGRLPNLKVEDIRIRTDGSYAVLVANTGKDVAVRPSVLLFVDDEDAGAVTAGTLGPGKQRWLRGYTSHPCVGHASAVADPMGRLRESAEDDNGRTASCLELTTR